MKSISATDSLPPHDSSRVSAPMNAAVDSPPETGPNKTKRPTGCLVAGGIGLALMLLVALGLIWAGWRIYSGAGLPLGILASASATPTTAPPTETATPTDTPVPPTDTPEPTATATDTPEPTATDTPVPSPTPTDTHTPTATLTPTEAALIATAKSQAFCRYGPSTAFLPNVDIFTGDTMAVDGRYQYGSWLWVKPDKVDRHCWIAASLVDPVIDPSTVPIVDHLVSIPFTTDISPPANVSAVRNGSTVTISWDAINVSPEGFRGYLIDAFVCQNGVYLKFIANTNNTSYSITDEKNSCAGPSGAVLYGGTAIGYTSPITIAWP